MKELDTVTLTREWHGRLEGTKVTIVHMYEGKPVCIAEHESDTFDVPLAYLAPVSFVTEASALREKHKDLLQEWSEFNVKYNNGEFTEEELAYHGADPLEDEHWGSLMIGYMIGKGVPIAEAMLLETYFR